MSEVEKSEQADSEEPLASSAKDPAKASPGEGTDEGSAPPKTAADSEGSEGTPDPSEAEAATAPPGGEDAAARADDAAPEAPKKKKKKKKRAVDEPKEPRTELDAEGRERPQFVLDFPSDPALERLVRAFELGNYAYVRAHAPELAESSEDARVRDAAAELARRIQPDPLVKILLAMSVALLLLVTIWTYRTHGP